jgi:hypothetical protein
MGMPLQRAPHLFQGGGVLAAHDESAFFIVYDYLFILVNNLFFPTPIQLLKNCVKRIDALPHLQLYLFPRRACNVSFICCGDGKLSYFTILSISLTNLHYFPSPHWQNTSISISRHPLVIVETVKSKSLQIQGIILHNPPTQTWCLHLYLATILGSQFLPILQLGF